MWIFTGCYGRKKPTSASLLRQYSPAFLCLCYTALHSQAEQGLLARGLQCPLCFLLLGWFAQETWGRRQRWRVRSGTPTHRTIPSERRLTREMMKNLPLLVLILLVVVQWLSPVWLFVTPWTAACQAPPSSTISQSLLKLMSIESMMTSNHLILCCPLLLLPLIFPSIRVFSNELVLHIRWPKYWSFSITPFNEYSGLVSFRMDWLDLLAVQGTLKSLLQHHSLTASILWSCLQGENTPQTS